MAVTLDSLKKAVKKTKGRSQALAWLADMERAAGDYEAALKLVDEALAASPSDVPAMLVRAKILVGQQDFAGSITEYKKVLAKDPFCLSAHKRMGESYDKLGKIAERNACFRRVHDMDPLDSFWKDEYDVLTEEEQASLVPPPMDDSSFTMDVDTESEIPETTEEDNIFANLAASLPNTDEEDNTSMDALRSSLDIASDELAKDGVSSEIPEFDDQVLNSSEVSSAISGILGGDDDFDITSGPAEKEEPATSSLFSHFGDNDEIESLDEPAKSDEASEELVEEKPNEVAEEKSDESVFSLDSIDEPQPAEEAETNVDDAFSSIFGDDDLPEEKPAEETETAAQTEPEESLGSLFEKSAESEEIAELETPAEPVAEESASEENVAETSSEPAEESLSSLFEKSADSAIPSMHMDFSDEETGADKDDILDLDEKPKTEEAETNVDDAFTSIFGDDDLPEEKPAEVEDTTAEVAEPAAENAESAELEMPAESAAETVAESAELDAPAESVAEETVAETPAEPAEEESFGSLFEKSADADFSLDDEAPAAEETAATETVEPAAETAEPVFETAESTDSVPSMHMDFSEEEAPSKTDDDFVLNLDEEPAAEQTATEQTASAEVAEPTAETAAAESPAVEETQFAEDESAADEVDGAFDALFGDETSEDETVAETPAEEQVAEVPAEVAESAAESAEFEMPAEPVAENAELEMPAESASESVAESAELELPAEEQVADAPVELAEAPAAEEPALETAQEPAQDEDVAKEMGGAFASMFGDEDRLDLPEENKDAPAEVTLTEEPLSQEATGAEIEESSVKEDVKDNVEESFDSIFGKADDDLPEEPSETVEAAPAEVAETPVAEEPAPTSVFSAPADSFEEPAVASEALADVDEKPAEQLAEAPSAELDSIDSEVSNAFKGLFDEDDSLTEADEPNNKGVDYLMSGDSDDEVSASLVNDADAPLSRGAADLDDSLNTRTLADIYMEQGVYSKALEIYSDLAKKNPNNAEIKSRLEEVEKLCREKFGEG